MKRVAIIGSGISGLSCAWVLSTSKEHSVTLYEADDYLGGHSNTVDVVNKKTSKKVSVDTGFIVFNDLNYPNLRAMLKHLSVPTEDSDMSFALSVGKGGIEWAGNGLGAVFAQWHRIFSYSHWKMLFEIARFGKEAPSILDKKEFETMSMEEYLKKNNYSAAFVDNYLLPITAAVWSTPLSGMLNFPAQTLIQFMHNHQMLQMFDRPQWKTVTNGCREYVKKIRQQLETNGATIKLSSPVTAVKREESKGKLRVLVSDKSGTNEFDFVVFACHADTAIKILKDPSSEETQLVGNFKYSKNITVLHSDEKLMPRSKKVWSSWNYLRDGSGKDKDNNIMLTYWMNKLQPFIPNDFPLFVTLNPIINPDPSKVYQKITYEHPIYTPNGVSAQKKLQQTTESRGLYFIGAYCGFGFHEDGLLSGLKAAESLGAKCPWTVDKSRYVSAPHGRIPSAPGLDALVLLISVIVVLVTLSYVLLS